MNGNFKKILGGVIILAVLAFGGYKIWGNKNKSPYADYVEFTVKKGNIKIQILSTGIVQPENKVEIKPPIAGRVEKVLVKEGDIVRKGQILAWMSSTERAALLDAASSRGKDELKEWEEMYRATPIIAAINGTVIQRNVESGQTFTTTDAILVMSDRLTVKAQVDETDIAQIKLKEQAKITLDAYPEETISAEVDQIAFDAKTVNNVTTYVVDVLPKTTPKTMRSGMTANVSFDIASKENVLLIPNESVKNVEGKNYILLPNKNDPNKTILREIELGLTDGKKTEIISGINENEIILMKEFKLKEKKSGSGSPFSPMGKGHGK
jgi:macrolide-specific efflux system membrane fusion protein